MIWLTFRTSPITLSHIERIPDYLHILVSRRRIGQDRLSFNNCAKFPLIICADNAGTEFETSPSGAVRDLAVEGHGSAAVDDIAGAELGYTRHLGSSDASGKVDHFLIGQFEGWYSTSRLALWDGTKSGCEGRTYEEC